MHTITISVTFADGHNRKYQVESELAWQGFDAVRKVAKKHGKIVTMRSVANDVYEVVCV
jgi:hypothetical protein